jgi:hypothetical protein
MHVAAQLAVGIAAEQPGLDVDAGKAKALRREARHFLVGQLGADRQRLEILRLFAQRLKRRLSRSWMSTTCASAAMVSSRLSPWKA